jgi:hypothetical protein
LKHPVIEIRGIVSKRQSSQWLALSPEKKYVLTFRDIRSRLIQNVRYRTMTAKGKTFVWAPDGGSICVRV